MDQPPPTPAPRIRIPQIVTNLHDALEVEVWKSDALSDRSGAHSCCSMTEKFFSPK